MKQDVFFSNNSSEWSTPKWLYDQLDGEFRFQLDAAASTENHKCDAYYTKDDDALSMPWAYRTFVNPPFGRDLGKWVEKAQKEWNKGKTIVLLLPARTDTQWFHRWIYHRHEVRFMSCMLLGRKL